MARTEKDRAATVECFVDRQSPSPSPSQRGITDRPPRGRSRAPRDRIPSCRESMPMNGPEIPGRFIDAHDEGPKRVRARQRTENFRSGAIRQGTRRLRKRRPTLPEPRFRPRYAAMLTRAGTRRLPFRIRTRFSLGHSAQPPPPTLRALRTETEPRERASRPDRARGPALSVFSEPCAFPPGRTATHQPGSTRSR